MDKYIVYNWFDSENDYGLQIIKDVGTDKERNSYRLSSGTKGISRFLVRILDLENRNSIRCCS